LYWFIQIRKYNCIDLYKLSTYCLFIQFFFYLVNKSSTSAEVIFLHSFMKNVCEKIVYIFEVFLAKCACCIVDGFPRICLELLNWENSSAMCLMVCSSLSQSSQIGQSSLVMRRKCVKRECPIRVLAITSSSRLDEGEGILMGGFFFWFL